MKHKLLKLGTGLTAVLALSALNFINQADIIIAKNTKDLKPKPTNPIATKAKTKPAAVNHNNYKPNVNYHNYKPNVNTQVIQNEYLDYANPIHKIKPIPDLYTRTPRITYFSDNLCQKCYLNGQFFNTKFITYDLTNLPEHEKHIAQDAIQQINDLHLVHLQQAAPRQIPDIIMQMSNDPNVVDPINHKYILADTASFHSKINHNNLVEVDQAIITFYAKALQIYSTGPDYDLNLNEITIHEIGHALGLKHIDNNIESDIIMNPRNAAYHTSSYDRLHTYIDQYYKNCLALIYRNF